MRMSLAHRYIRLYRRCGRLVGQRAGSGYVNRSVGGLSVVTHITAEVFSGRFFLKCVFRHVVLYVDRPVANSWVLAVGNPNRRQRYIGYSLNLEVSNRAVRVQARVEIGGSARAGVLLDLMGRNSPQPQACAAHECIIALFFKRY